MKKSVPKYRGQRISHADLVAESRETLRQAGVGNHERAMFITELSKAVVGNKNPLLYQIQPKMRFHTSKAWKKAYDLVFTFIAENNLEKTLETIGVEMGETLQQTSQRLANESGMSFSYVLNVDRGTDTFDQRVRRYAQNSDSESISERAPSPPQTHKGVQNTPERKSRQQNQSSFSQAPREEPKKEEVKQRRTKRAVKRTKKPENLSIQAPPHEEINSSINPTLKGNTANKNIILGAPEGELSPNSKRGGGFSQKLPPMKPTDPQEAATIDKSNYPKPLSPSKGQSPFSRDDKNQQQRNKPKDQQARAQPGANDFDPRAVAQKSALKNAKAAQQEQKRKLKVKGMDYFMDTLRSSESDYEVTTQSEFEVSEQDMKHDILSSSTE
ncbi:hypothetical protein TRFO_26317 [Tritrichomonas foetus]|uniref:Uncharacterized protein n=1 Tax=Tritrichomonas foetus TaxID=1144522 RepID=A0A1J4K367_9EUKA|nr:hypothetical protein TRFO_26317 [Tritrichomonas foetus]|eukprot:OHT05815.1 hypothetical protein TRFO_26317 [Tritrichomonas foetus]